MASILVIDDEKDLLSLYLIALEKNGYTVFLADNGQDGIMIFDNNDIDLVITDLKMPVMDGHEVAHHVRFSEKGHVPVIGMSGTPWKIMPQLFDEVIVKPFRIESLVNIIRSLISTTVDECYSV